MPGQPSEIIAWRLDHPSLPATAPEPVAEQPARADPTRGRYDGATAPIPPTPDDHSTLGPPTPLGPLRGPGLDGLPDGTAWQLAALVDPTPTEDTHDHC